MLSSLKLSSKTLIGKQQSKKLKNILQSLLNSNDSLQFRVPVDWKTFGLLDYPQIVKYPMDLGTVNHRFGENSYQFVQEVLDEIQLVWDNAKLYNHAENWVHILAEKLQRSFKKMVKNYLPYIAVTVPGRNPQLTKQDRKISQTSNNQPQPSPMIESTSPNEVPYQQKLALAQKLKTLSPHDLGSIVEYIMERYPVLFKETGEQSAELLVDNFGVESFRDVCGKVEEMAGDLVVKRVARE